MRTPERPLAYPWAGPCKTASGMPRQAAVELGTSPRILSTARSLLPAHDGRRRRPQHKFHREIGRGAANNRGSEHVIHISLSSELARAADILPEHERTYFRGAMGSDPPARRSAFHAETMSAARSTRLGRLSERRLPHASHAMRMQRKSCDVAGVDPRDNRTKYGTRAPLHTVKIYFITVQVHLV